MKKNYKDIIILVLLAAAFVILIVFEAVKIRFSDDGVFKFAVKGIYSTHSRLAAFLLR